MCTKCIIRAAVIAAVSVVSSTQAGSADTSADTLAAQARGIVKAFAGDLKQTLVSAIKADGPVHAIGVCNTAAPDIAANKSQASGWRVGRTSAKLRNTANAPDEWEARVLQIFARKKAEGADLKKLQYYEITEQNGKKQFRYMKAIGVGKPCLTCHGTGINEPVKKAIRASYPEDAATGFNLGDLRGAFTLTKPLN